MSEFRRIPEAARSGLVKAAIPAYQTRLAHHRNLGRTRTRPRAKWRSHSSMSVLVSSGDL